MLNIKSSYKEGQTGTQCSSMLTDTKHIS